MHLSTGRSASGAVAGLFLLAFCESTVSGAVSRIRLHQVPTEGEREAPCRVPTWGAAKGTP